VTWLEEHLGWKMQTVQRAKIPARGLLVAEGEEPDWEARFPSGFVPLPRRWVVERTFSQDPCAHAAWLVITKDYLPAVRRSSSFR
jgi:hypothetical protein